MQRLLPSLMSQFQQRVNGLHLSVVSFTDYDIHPDQPVTPYNFSADINAFSSLLNSIRPHGAASPADCYELALQQARTRLGWTQGSVKCLLVMGDSFPHQRGEILKFKAGGKKYDVTVEADWVQEATMLTQQLVRISGIHFYPINQFKTKAIH